MATPETTPAPTPIAPVNDDAPATPPARPRAVRAINFDEDPQEPNVPDEDADPTPLKRSRTAADVPEEPATVVEGGTATPPLPEEDK